MKTIITYILLLCITHSLEAQRERAFDINEKLGRGINYGNMLEAPSESAWGNPWSSRYPEIIAKLGFSHVRVPIRWETPERSSSISPYTIAPDFMARVKEVVNTSLANGLMTVINMHHHDQLYAHPDAQKERFLAQWAQISAEFKDYSDSVVFEILNEPHGDLTPEKWNIFLRDALEVIRIDNPGRVVLIGTAEYGGLQGLSGLDLPDDPNIIVSVHYYNPFQFTHQGAEWVGEDSDAWLGTEWQDTDVERSVVENELAQLIAFSKSKSVPVHIGEFGAYSTADIVSREKWTTYLARYFEELGWSWAYWEFSAGFGIYNPSTKTYVQELVDALLHNALPEPATYERTKVYQSDFTNGTDGWHLQTNGGAVAALSGEENALHVSISQEGTENWHVQLTRSNLALEAGKKYSVTFTGRSDAPRNVSWYIGMSVDPWSAYSSWNQAGLNETLNTFTSTFDMGVTDNNARIAFDMGTSSHDVTVTKVVVEELNLKLPDNNEPGTTLYAKHENRVLVYPNPVTDLLYIDNVVLFHKLTIVDLTGQNHLTSNLTASRNTISLQHLDPGTYLVTLEGDGAWRVIKVILKR